jgi:hypothetical protein
MKVIRRFTVIALLLCLIVLLASAPLSAQEEKKSTDETVDIAPDMEPEAIEEASWLDGARTYLYSQYIADSNFSGYDGGYSVASANVGVGYKNFTLWYSRHVYSWNGIDRLPFGNGRDNPWDTLHTLGFYTRHSGRISGKWSYYVNGGVYSAFEEYVAAPTVIAGANIGYDLTPRITFRLGAVTFLHPRVRTFVLPVAGFTFNRSERRGIASKGFSFSLGLPETSVSYRFNPIVSTRIAGWIERNLYHLATGNTVQSNGYIEDYNLVSGVFLDLTPMEKLRVSIGVGYDFVRSITFYNRDGHERGSYDLDAAPSGSLRVDYRF